MRSSEGIRLAVPDVDSNHESPRHIVFCRTDDMRRTFVPPFERSPDRMQLRSGSEPPRLLDFLPYRGTLWAEVPRCLTSRPPPSPLTSSA